jgi:ribosome biogenesis GTPase A
MNDILAISNNENKKYLASDEWKQAVEKARNTQSESYTCIYRDTDEKIKEGWHFISEDNIEYVKNKYLQAKKEIIYFGLMPKEGYGHTINQFVGSSKSNVL